ncbi:MAG: hypothetical protein NZ805_04375 [Armatimonadetes bacterium]|nr:hypothetical protein [Armatimonadota bacterium]MDW8027308.1 hypothetical protein [Armatimonadota bacterium]
MTMVARKAAEGTNLMAPTLKRTGAKAKPKHQPLTSLEIAVKWLILPSLLALTWCFVNSFALMEAKSCSWKKRQIYAKEMKIQQLQASIAIRLSNLTAKSALSQSSQPIKPMMLTIKLPKQKSILLGRR